MKLIEKKVIGVPAKRYFLINYENIYFYLMNSDTDEIE